MAMGESPSAMEDLDATNVIQTEKEETEEKTATDATVEKYPSFVLFTILNGILLVLTILAGSAFIIIGNFLDAFGSSKLWGSTNHFYLDIEIVTVCLFGFITAWKKTSRCLELYLLFSGFGIVAQLFCGIVVFAFHLAVLIEYGHTLSVDMKISILMTIFLNLARFVIHLPLFFVAYDLGFEVKKIDPNPEGPDFVPSGFDPTPKGRIFLPPGPPRVIYIKPAQDNNENPGPPRLIYIRPVQKNNENVCRQRGDQPTERANSYP